jgi:hypothetical protein
VTASLFAIWSFEHAAWWLRRQPIARETANDVVRKPMRASLQGHRG